MPYEVLRTREVMEKTGATSRQLHYWNKHGIVPCVNTGPIGHGYHMEYLPRQIPHIATVVHVANAFHGRLSGDILRGVYANTWQGHLIIEGGVSIRWPLPINYFEKEKT